MASEKQKLSYKQDQLYQYIKNEIFAHGFPPTRQEMADHFKWSSPNAAHDMLLAIERKGHIRVIRFKSRAIEILE